MSEVDVPFDDAREAEPDEAPVAEDELDIEAPEADAVEQHLEVELDEDEYR
jgi:hypothetical protein